jgi:trimethylamine:corrinoid methyltransferase-like protein
LKAYEPPELEPAVLEALLAFIDRRERELEGINLYDE